MKQLLLTLLLGIVVSGLSAQGNFAVITPIGEQTGIGPINKNLSIGFGRSSTCTELLKLVINGPFTDNNGEFIGGYIDNGIQKKPFIDPKTKTGNFAEQNGIFGLGANGQMYLIPYDNWNGNINFKWAFQNGRILLLNGSNIHNKASNNKMNRSGIGFTSDNSLVFVINSNITYWELANELKKMGCVNAILLGNDAMPGFAFKSDNQSETHGLIDNAMKIQFYDN